jgi:pimeloyl-ACP methyl ester carboxylesterase
VLDSVLNPAGRDPLDRSTYAAFPRVLRDVCSAGCQGITRDPVADLTKLVSRVRKHPLKATAFSAAGRPLRGNIGEADVSALLESADFDPFARAEIPAALVSATRGDGAPLARLIVRESALGASLAGLATTPVMDNQALFFATACEEIAFPWSRTAPLSERPGDLVAALATVPASTYAPFSRAVVASTGTSRPCLHWPDGSPDSPLVSGPAPDVPVLLLEGVDDTRTPLADAQAAAALFPRASLVAVPGTGHSVVGTDLSDCSQTALGSFFANGTAGPCLTAARISPTRVDPTSLRGLKPPRGVSGKRGRTIAAVAAASADTLKQAIARGALGTPLEGGGLRGGHFQGSLTGSVLTVQLHRLVYVPGVRVTGTIRLDLASNNAPSADVSVAGRAAAKGTLRFRGGAFTGRLDGKAVHSHAKAAAAGLPSPQLRWDALLRLRRTAGLRRASAGR